jgi:hypothetical protein
MEGKEKHKEIIKLFLEQMTTQDHRGTAFPIYYVIRTSEIQYTNADMADDVRYLDLESGEVEEFSSVKEAIAKFKEYEYTPDEIKSSLENLTRVGVTKVWTDRGMFLTESDADAHLKRNHYHYSEDAHTYVRHAWRAPELKEFLISLFEYFDVTRDKGND